MKHSEGCFATPATRALGRFVRHAASLTLGSSRISDAARHPYWARQRSVARGPKPSFSRSYPVSGNPGRSLRRYSGWGGRIRTYGTRYQKPLPYHLATPQQRSLSRNECLECFQLQIQPEFRSIADSLIVRSDFGFLLDQLVEIPEYMI